MTKYAKAWEDEVKRCLEGGMVTPEDYETHLRKIAWLQHERVVHLLVMLFVAFVLFGVFAVLLFIPNLLLGGLLLILMVLTGFYVYHYYYLENTVQRWYVMADQLERQLKANRRKT